MVEIGFLHCAKCGVSFAPKSLRNVPRAIERLRIHRKHCKGKKHRIAETSSSVTLESGRHVVSRSWREVS